MPLPPVSVAPVAEIGTELLVHAVEPPDTDGAVGATVSTDHLYVAERVVLPRLTRTENECAPCLRLAYEWVLEHFAYAPVPRRQVTVSPVPVVFHANFAVVLRAAVAGWVVILTVTAVEAGSSAFAAAGAAISRHAKAAITADRGKACSLGGRGYRWGSAT